MNIKTLWIIIISLLLMFGVTGCKGAETANVQNDSSDSINTIDSQSYSVPGDPQHSTFEEPLFVTEVPTIENYTEDAPEGNAENDTEDEYSIELPTANEPIMEVPEEYRR